MSTQRTVPLLDLTRLDDGLRAELHEAFSRVLASGHYIMGPEVEALERECAAYIGARHAISVSSGTDALLAVLMALDLGPGDEVICPTYSFFATAGCVWRTGARVVFADILPETWNIDPADVARKLTPKTKAIMPVHLFGQCAAMDPLLELAAERRIPIIEDAAQAIGSSYRKRSAGTIGAVGCFSFFPSKNLGGLGDGGLVTTDDSALADKLRMLRVHGGKPKYHHRIVGGNFRLDALQAALLRPKLARLDDATARRQENAALYTRLFIESGVALPGLTAHERVPLRLPEALETRHIYNQYILDVRGAGTRDKLRDHLKSVGVGSEVYYPIPLHLQECFSALGHKRGDFPVSERAALHTLAIPIFPELEEAELRYVVESVASFFK